MTTKIAREELPVTPELVTWARSRAGLSVEEAKKKFRYIEEWENGEAGPTYSQLEELADTLKVPVAVFFFPKPPELPPISETFRTLPEVEFGQIPSRIQLLLRKAKAFQLNLSELTGGRGLSERLITRDVMLGELVPQRVHASRLPTFRALLVQAGDAPRLACPLSSAGP